MCHDNNVILGSPSSGLARVTSISSIVTIPISGVEISKTELTFGLSKNDRFPVDKKQRDQVQITNTSNSVKKFRVYVPSDVSRFNCQVSLFINIFKFF